MSCRLQGLKLFSRFQVKFVFQIILKFFFYFRQEKKGEVDLCVLIQVGHIEGVLYGIFRIFVMYI